MLKITRLLLIAILAGGCGAPGKTLTGDKDMQPQSVANKIQLPVESEMPSFEGATGWLNSKPLTRDDLKGKVVVVEFWTYTCINWLRTAPYVRAWADKYKDKGLVVIGVHTPEFEFEKNIENARQGAIDQNVGYPIAVDSDYAIWNAFGNQYWPALYFVDSQGRIRHHHFGEGEYDRSERVIQELLAEAGQRDVSNELVQARGEGLEAAADWENLGSPENYLGYGRTENFASPGGIVRDQHHRYEFPGQLMLNQWSLSGDWIIGRSAVVLNLPNGRVAYRFRARDLHLVMAPPNSQNPVRFRVSIDGKPPGDAHGIDVDAGGNGVVTQSRLYQLIRQAEPDADRQFEIEFLDSGVEVYVFTFG